MRPSTLAPLKNRRTFLAGSLSLLGVSVLAACGAAPAGPPVGGSGGGGRGAIPTPPELRMAASATPTSPAAKTPTRAPQSSTPVPSPTLALSQPADASPRAFMDVAAQMRQYAVERGDQAFGAIIVRDRRIVGLGPSRVVINQDPTAHAEMEAIRDACRRLGERSLWGCVMYSTSKPCRMCETAAYYAGIIQFVYGDGLADGGAPKYDAC